MIGNLCHKPRLTLAKNGTAFAKAVFAVNQDNSPPKFYTLVAYNETAEILARLPKGQQLVAVGKIYHDPRYKLPLIRAFKILPGLSPGERVMTL